MFIPIKNPSNEKEVIGIFRMVNKMNVSYDSTIDYFNDADVEIMMDAAEYLALIIANYQKEEMQYEFIDKLTHEFITPANAIWKTASRLYYHYSENDFVARNLLPYLKNIIDFAEQQRWQASTNLFLSRNRRKIPFEVRYNIRPTLLWDVIKKSIDIAIPIARKYYVPFRNIYIDLDSDRRLAVNIDKDAFVSVFYNLYTNAIKYHDPDNIDRFYIETSYWIEKNVLIVEIEDNGIGIKQDEQSKIFEKGYRSESAIRINASGYGIGLTIIKQIIEDFGGEIKIASLKAPTIFHIEIPLNKIK
jgi:signal transduction histidine kinase